MTKHSLHILSCAAILALASGGAEAAQLRMLTAWDTSYSAVTHIAIPYVENVKAASNGGIAIATFGPETVPPFEQLQPMSAGVFDLIFTHGGNHIGTTGIAASLDGMTGDVTKRREVGIFEWVDRYYQEKFNLKLLSIPTTTTGYHYMLKRPLDDDGTWKGRMIRSAGAHAGPIRALGGQPVLMPAGEIYTSVEKGVVEGLGWPAAGSIGYKFYEVAPYIVRPTFGTVSYVIFANLNAFRRLTPAEQKVLLDEGEKLEAQTLAVFNKLVDEETAEMVKRGAKIVEAKLTREQFHKLHSDQVWQNVYKATPGQDGQKLYEFAKSKGMTQ